MNELCSEEVRRGDDWHPRREPCGKKAKGEWDGKPLCGTHLRSYRMAAEKKTARDQWNERLSAVKQALGCEVWGWDVDRPVSVRIEALESLAERLRAAEGDQ